MWNIGQWVPFVPFIGSFFYSSRVEDARRREMRNATSRQLPIPRYIAIPARPMSELDANIRNLARRTLSRTENDLVRSLS